MEVVEAIKQARLYANRAATMARVLARLKPLIVSTATTVELRADEDRILVEFVCQDEHVAWKIGQALHLDVKLTYSGSSAVKYGCYETQENLLFEFKVQTVRPITIEECRLVRRKKENGMIDAALSFNGLELVKMKMWDDLKGAALKQKLFIIAAGGNGGRYRRDSYRFVL